MSSLSDIQQIYAMLQEIDRLLAKIDTTAKKTEEQVTKTMTQVLYAERVIQRVMGLFQRLGLPEDINNAIYKLRQLLLIINQVRLAMVALYAGHPILAGISLMMVAMDTADLALAS